VVEFRRVLLAVLLNRGLEIGLRVSGGLVKPSGPRLGERHGLVGLRDARLRLLFEPSPCVIGDRLAVGLLGTLDNPVGLVQGR
jgi:hypothetical protein